MRFTEPYWKYDLTCFLCGNDFVIETLSEKEDEQSDFLRDEEQRCLDCLEMEFSVVLGKAICEAHNTE